MWRRKFGIEVLALRARILIPNFLVFFGGGTPTHTPTPTPTPTPTGRSERPHVKPSRREGRAYGFAHIYINIYIYIYTYMYHICIIYIYMCVIFRTLFFDINSLSLFGTHKQRP